LPQLTRFFENETMAQETVLNPEISSHSELPIGLQPNVQEEEGIDLITLATLLLREKKIILRFAAAAFVLAIIVVYGLMQPTYTAEAVFLPPQTSPGSSMSQLASQLGSLGAIGGLAGLKSPGDVYLGILGSRTIADELIQRFDLQKVYKTKKLSSAEKTLKSNSKFVSGKDTLVTISVSDHDPKRAAALANGYLDVLHEQNGRLALTEASQRRLFFEQQLEREKDSLANAEVELKKTQEQTGLIMPGGQAQVEIEAIAQIRAQITSRQVELAALKQSSTEQNPAVIRLQTEIAGLQQQLQKMQNDTAQRQPGTVQLPTAKVPELALEYVRKQREVKYHEVLFELIARQYEAARLDESREAPLLQIVDHAVVPDGKSGPPRTLLILASGLFGAFVGMIWAGLKYFAFTLEQDPARAAQVEALRQAAQMRH
jgi:tyrosine-protein kinase Etk/Wzc